AEESQRKDAVEEGQHGSPRGRRGGRRSRLGRRGVAPEEEKEEEEEESPPLTLHAHGEGQRDRRVGGRWRHCRRRRAQAGTVRNFVRSRKAFCEKEAV